MEYMSGLVASEVYTGISNIVLAIINRQTDKQRLEIEMEQVMSSREFQRNDFALKNAFLDFTRHAFDRKMDALEIPFRRIMDIMEQELFHINTNLNELYKQRKTMYKDLEYRNEIIRLEGAKEKLILNINRIYKDARETAFALFVPGGIENAETIISQYSSGLKKLGGS